MLAFDDTFDDDSPTDPSAPSPPPLAVHRAPPVPDRSVGKRWRHDALFKKGHVQVPTTFLRAYATLQPSPLTHGEAMFVIHLMQYKWDQQAPFPSYKTIAKQMGVSDKQARRLAVALEHKGYLEREFREGISNRFDLTPLFNALLRHQQQQESRGKV